MNIMQPLNIPTYPLHGQSLIEASAGTGKTYTIAQLYNRLLMGHGRGFEDKLACNNLLVVTFTNAATQELRGRLRGRIQETFQQCLRFENDLLDTNDDDKQFLSYLSDLGISSKESSNFAELKDWLKANLALMDEASIFTIHSFCQRMLKRFAFDTGVMFSADLTLDSDQYLRQACEDVWRQVAYGLDEAESAALLDAYAGPENLIKLAQSRINKPDIEILPWTGKLGFKQAAENFKKAFYQAQKETENYTQADIVDWFAQSDVNKRSYSSRNTPNWTAQNFAFLQGKPSTRLPDAITRFDPNSIQESSKSGTRPDHPLFNAVEALISTIEPLKQQLRLGWLEEIKTRYWELLEKSGAMTNDDLMRLLNQALKGPQGDALATQIREIYPVAMIDEFQDTDAAQYEIFNKIYPNEAEANHALIMIGDPKQAIYAFRGADIFTYIKAKQALNEQQIFTLGTNYRSHSQLIAGVNQLFEKNDNPFLYNDDIPFVAVDSGKQQDEKYFSVNGTKQAPLQIWHQGEEIKRAKAKYVVAKECAEKIAELIYGDAKLGDEKVKAGDIVILVRSGPQANIIRNALQEQGVSSVFLTRDSVFKSQEAKDLFFWLQAVAHPNDERALRTALASAIQEKSAEQLAKLFDDEEAWEAELELQKDYHHLWRTRGVMAAIVHWLETNDLAVRLRAQSNGERRLTNLMHLGDLLQGASRQLQGQETLLRWFGERVFDEVHAGDEAQLRLESDANLVSITTIHRSKGLQYPLVFLPYLWDDGNELRRDADTIYYDEDRKQVVLHLSPDTTEKELAKKANTAENLRLLYVALTRAEQGCFIWLPQALTREKPFAFDTALGYLLQLEHNAHVIVEQDAKGKEKNILRISETYLKNTYTNDSTYVGELPNWEAEQALQEHEAEVNSQVEAKHTLPKKFDSWRVSSYSQLVAHAPEPENAPETLVSLHQDEQSLPNQFIEEVQVEETDIAFNPEDIAFTFAKGPQAGNALHDILENWDFHDVEQLQEVCAQKLEHYGLELDEAQQPLLADWLQAFVHTPLFNAADENFCLADIQAEQRLNEMEFHLPVTGLQTYQLEKLLGESGRFTFYPLSGFLKGFIDLIFEHEGRYYVADYKSNFLGTEASAYLGANLQQAMLGHAYDLQAWIYIVALDAVLQQRVPNYDPEQHLGGVYYFFMRAMHLGENAPVVTDETGQQQTPGVYYRAVDLAELKQWRAVFLNQPSQGELSA